MARRDQYNRELAETVSDMFGNGTTDPSAEEIAETHFKNKALGGEITDGIRKRLRTIRDLLRDDYDLRVFLLSPRYYVRFREEPPTTEAEARLCIPSGHAVSADGIGLLSKGGPSELIYQAALSMNVASGAGKLKKSVDDAVGAVVDHQFSPQLAGATIRDAKRRTEPADPKHARKILHATRGRVKALP